MFKQLISATPTATLVAPPNWLNLEHLARVDLSSEDANHPIESSLQTTSSSGWRAATAGTQTIRLLFDHPQHISRIHLYFLKTHIARTQKYILRWSDNDGTAQREIVRQQWNFNPKGACAQTEDYQDDLAGLRVLELCIAPDISGSDADGMLAQLRVA